MIRLLIDYVAYPSIFFNREQVLSRTPHGCVDDNADMEMYKGDSKFRIARITAFVSTCPMCSARIELDYGKPDHKELLIGQCRESPLAHVYRFDRDTLKGFFLGHEAYLK